jgi:predicted DNA-binding ribbon-helix-helix protein
LIFPLTKHISETLSEISRESFCEQQAGCGTLAKRCMLYIVRRTQLYLDDHLWNALHARARREQTTISELVRQAIRERYLDDREGRAKAMRDIIGVRADSDKRVDSTEYIREFRNDNRLERLYKE